MEVEESDHLHGDYSAFSEVPWHKLPKFGGLDGPPSVCTSNGFLSSLKKTDKLWFVHVLLETGGSSHPLDDLSSAFAPGELDAPRCSQRSPLKTNPKSGSRTIFPVEHQKVNPDFPPLRF